MRRHVIQESKASFAPGGVEGYTEMRVLSLWHYVVRRTGPMLRGFLSFLLLSVSVMVGCVTDLGAPLEPADNAPLLTSDLDEAELTYQEVSEQGIIIGYPAGWEIEAGHTVTYIVPDAEQFPWKRTYSPLDFTILIVTRDSYTNHGNRRTHIPQSAAAVLSDLPTSMTGEMLVPVTSVDAAGRDGAIYLVGNDYRQLYRVVVRVTSSKAVTLTAEGPADKSEEMQSILNAMALHVRPIE